MAARTRARPTPALRHHPEPENAPAAKPGAFLTQSFVAHGNPTPKARPRFYKGHTITDPHTVLAEAQIRARARKAGVVKMAGDLEVWLVYFRATRVRCDWDNLAKLTCDALNGIAWTDDSQIVAAHVRVGHDPANPRTEVEISSLTPPSPLDWDQA